MAIRKSIIRYEVVYDDAELNLDCLSLSDIDYLTMEGEASGRFLDSDEKILSNEEAYEALEAQGSDPEFMGLHRCSSCQKVFQNFSVDEEVLCENCGD
jgi:hypothetical protein